jgi:hypothetical protein
MLSETESCRFLQKSGGEKKKNAGRFARLNDNQRRDSNPLLDVTGDWWSNFDGTKAGGRQRWRRQTQEQRSLDDGLDAGRQHDKYLRKEDMNSL